MHLVDGYAVWPSPSQATTWPVPSMSANFAVDSNGVAGSPLVPTTRIVGAPLAGPTGYGSCLACHTAHPSSPMASGAPNSGYLARHWDCSVRIWSTVGYLSESAQFTAESRPTESGRGPPGSGPPKASPRPKMRAGCPLGSL